MSDELEKLVKVVDEIDPATLTRRDVEDIMAWGAEKVGFVLVDMDQQTILHATQGAEDVFGYMRDEMVGLNLTELVPDEFKDVHPHHVKDFNKAPAMRSMGRRDRPLMGKQRDGKTFTVEISLYPRKFRNLRLCLANVVRLSKEI